MVKKKNTDAGATALGGPSLSDHEGWITMRQSGLTSCVSIIISNHQFCYLATTTTFFFPQKHFTVLSWKSVRSRHCTMMFAVICFQNWPAMNHGIVWAEPWWPRKRTRLKEALKWLRRVAHMWALAIEWKYCCMFACEYWTCSHPAVSVSLTFASPMWRFTFSLCRLSTACP